MRVTRGTRGARRPGFVGRAPWLLVRFSNLDSVRHNFCHTVSVMFQIHSSWWNTQQLFNKEVLLVFDRTSKLSVTRQRKLLDKISRPTGPKDCSLNAPDNRRDRSGVKDRFATTGGEA